MERREIEPQKLNANTFKNISINKETNNDGEKICEFLIKTSPTC